MKKCVLLFFTSIILCYLVGCSSNKNKDINNENTPNTSQPCQTEINSILPSQLNTLTPSDLSEFQDTDEIHNNLAEICKNPRPIGSKEINATQDFISNKMISYGYNVDYQDFSFNKVNLLERMHTRTVDEYLSIQFKDNNNYSYYGTNIIASKASSNNDKTLYVCAHYDTTKDTNGEIDNGSGVVTILDIARKLAHYKLPVNVVFIFFSAEETGMSGSCYFVSNLSKEDKNQALGCINIDCVCQNQADTEIYMNIYGLSENALSLSLNKYHHFKYDSSTSSDHTAFYHGEIPAISFTDSPYTVKDNNKNRMKNIDTDKINEFSNILANYIITFKFSEYESYIEEDYKIDYLVNSKELTILDYSLQKLSLELTANGSRSKMIYLFRNSKGNTITFTKDNNRFVTSNERDKIEKGTGYKEFNYYINKTPKEIEIHYGKVKNEICYGILRCNESEKEALKMIEPAEDLFQSVSSITELITNTHNGTK